MTSKSNDIPAIKLETPSDAEIAAAIQTLSRLEKGRLPLDLFLQMARLATLSTVELVPIRNKGTEAEVLLLQRDKDDKHWPNQWHVPGTVIIPTDSLAHPHDFSAPLGRLIGGDGEMKVGEGVSTVAPPVYIDTERRKTERGDEMAAIHYVEVEGEPVVGRFFSMDEFPNNVPEAGVIDHHRDFIPRVIAQYMRNKGTK